YVRAHDREHGRNVGGSIGRCLPQRVAIELPQLRPFVQRLEVTYEPAADHVALESDVVAGRVHSGMDLAIRHLAAAEDPDLDHRPLGDLAQELAAEIVSAVVERDHRDPAQDHGPEALLRLLNALQGGDDRTYPTGGNRRNG